MLLEPAWFGKTDRLDRPPYLKRARKGLDAFFVPRTSPGSQPTIDAKWKKIEKDSDEDSDD
jgi:hypothetical protein